MDKNYQNKYLKYKQKYLNLHGGGVTDLTNYTVFKKYINNLKLSDSIYDKIELLLSGDEKLRDGIINIIKSLQSGDEKLRDIIYEIIKLLQSGDENLRDIIYEIIKSLQARDNKFSYWMQVHIDTIKQTQEDEKRIVAFQKEQEKKKEIMNIFVKNIQNSNYMDKYKDEFIIELVDKITPLIKTNRDNSNNINIDENLILGHQGLDSVHDPRLSLSFGHGWYFYHGDDTVSPTTFVYFNDENLGNNPEIFRENLKKFIEKIIKKYSKP